MRQAERPRHEAVKPRVANGDRFVRITLRMNLVAASIDVERAGGPKEQKTVTVALGGIIAGVPLAVFERPAGVPTSRSSCRVSR